MSDVVKTNFSPCLNYYDFGCNCVCSTADERPFKCDICGHGFPRKQQRDVHRVRHSKEKTHLCSICGTAFASQVGPSKACN